MTHIWSRWYESFFRTKDEESFLTAQWNSGLNHVNAGIDHRYIGLAYALARGFLHRTASSRLDPGQHVPALELLDRLLDLCLLVETDAFITSLSKCDHEIILGIAHQIRNPLYLSVEKVTMRQSVQKNQVTEQKKVQGRCVVIHT